MQARGTHLLRYAITDFTLGSASAPGPAAFATLRQSWLHSLHHWALGGFDFVQLREKALPAGLLFSLAREGASLLRSLSLPHVPRLLINGRPDIALAAVADGVHLPATEGMLLPAQVRRLWAESRNTAGTVSGSAHSPEEVKRAVAQGCDLVLFGPVFGKVIGGRQVREGVGLQALRLACSVAGPVPVLALGGVGKAEEAACRDAGAAGIAAIRAFAVGPAPEWQRKTTARSHEKIKA